MSKANNKRRQQAHRSKKQQNKERGGWLTAAIIYVIIHGILMLAILFGEHSYIRQLPGLPPTWVIATLAGAAIADIIAGIALWRWKMWGFYLYLASIVAVMIIGLLATGSALLAFSAIIPFAIVGYIMRPKWEFFE